MLELKEIAGYRSPTGGTKRYFQADHGDKKVLFSMREWESEKPRTIEEVKEIYLTAELPSYVTDYDYSHPLAILSLEPYTFRNELNPLNMSIWEYEVLIKGNKDAHPALKCAFIQNDDEEVLTIICESYDSDSMTTTENIRTVYDHWRTIRNEVLELLGKEVDYIEYY